MMSERVRGVVVAHGGLAPALVSAVEAISGVTGALRSVSNEGLGPEALRDVLCEAAGDRDTILFIDLAGGSCALAGLREVRENRARACITGVNLPMLLDFVFQRELPIEALVPRLLRRGRRGQRAHPGTLAGAD